MSHKTTLFSTFATLLLCVGCASTLTIQSDPEDSEVYINERLVGKTPLEMPLSDLPKEEFVRIQISKEGYTSSQFYSPSLSSTTSAQLSIRLLKRDDESTKINRQVEYIVKAQQAAHEKRLTDAFSLLDQALSENPRAIHAMILKGSLLFLNKNYESAKTQWKKVLQIDPANREAKALIETAQKVPTQYSGKPKTP